jgi:SAM-dependent methyltransferase
MHLDVSDLRNFYARPLGSVVRRLLGHRIRARWRRADGMTLVGLGYAAPYLGLYRTEATRLGALMPAEQGALVWPSSGPVRVAMVSEDALPLPDNSVDRLLAVHCIELADRPGPLLREMWRIMTPEGRLLLVVPNRRGVWARLDTTPFGQGRPYSRGQLEQLLTNALFTPTDWSGSLFIPPFSSRAILRWSTMCERVGAGLWPGFSGVNIVEARKELTAPIGRSATVRASGELASAPGSAARRQSPP